MGIIGAEYCFVVNGTGRMQCNGWSGTVQAKMQMRSTEPRQQHHNAKNRE